MTIESWSKTFQDASRARPVGELAHSFRWYADDITPVGVHFVMKDSDIRVDSEDFPALRKRLKELLTALGEPPTPEPTTITLKQLQDATARADQYIKSCARQGIAAGPHVNAPVIPCDGAAIWKAEPFPTPVTQITFRISREGNLILDTPILVKG